MTKRSQPSGAGCAQSIHEPRKTRLKAALQANIARRKGQARARAAEEPPVPRMPDPATSAWGTTDGPNATECDAGIPAADPGPVRRA